MKRNALLWVLIFSFVSLSFAAGPQNLVYLTEEYAPYNYTENDELRGISVDLLKNIWKEMGCPEQEIKVYPWARSYKMVQTKKNHVLFSMSRTDQREKLFKWVGPFHASKFILIGLAEKDIRIDSFAQANSYKIGTIREDVAEQLLKSNGVTSVESVPKIELNVKKLISGRIDLVACAEDGFNKYCKKTKHNPEKFKTYFIMQESASYYAFHKETSESLIEQFQKALDKVKAAGQLDKIIKKYMD